MKSWMPFHLGLAMTLGLLLSLSGQSPPTFEIDPGSGFGIPTVHLRWDSSDTVLQRSNDLQAGVWETLFETRETNEFSEPQKQHPVFYRLLRLSDSNGYGTSVQDLEWRLTEMNIHQIERALHPKVATSPGDRDLPPDDGDAAHSLNLFKQLVPFTWASQPGLIRIYKPGQPNFVRAFKLYSSKDSVASTADDLNADSARIRSWQQAPDRFTDLNAPTLLPDGSQRFPILDPRALDAGVEGFDYQDNTELGTLSGHALPMPAEWLYVLSDGSLGTLDEQGTWQGEGEAGDENPIVARLAYWADDETSKLNVNVASEGIAWDIPRADTPQERAYALRQPIIKEVQRFPGHPATTSLSTILSPGKAPNHPDEMRRLTDDELRLTYGLTPSVVFREPDSSSITFDDAPLLNSPEEWVGKAQAKGVDHADTLRGFITTSAPSPEISIHGLPRVSMWSVNEINSAGRRSPYDTQSAAVSSIGNSALTFLRRDSTSRHAELYSRASRHNINLLSYLIDQTYLKTPGYGKPLAAKYGAQRSTADYQDNTDYDKDHYVIALSMLDRLRSINALDPTVAQPYADAIPGANSGIGTVSGLNLIDRNLWTGNGSATHASSWHRSTLEPQSPGRSYVLSELALIAYVTGETTIESWSEEGPVFATDIGSDAEVRNRILSNEHPAYAEWIGRAFGPDDVGKTFVSIEIGLIPEVFSPSQSSLRKFPKQSLRLLTGGVGYRGGLSTDRGLRVNGIPLQLWGQSVESSGSRQPGPLISSTEGGFRLDQSPLGWENYGGAGGPRLFRFGTFTVDEDQEGWHGREFLPNVAQTLTHWLSQTPIILEKGQSLSFTQEEPIQIVLYDQGALGATTGNLEKLFHFRFAPPGEAFEVPAPILGEVSYRDWTSRIDLTVIDPETPLTAPDLSDSIKGLSISHGDVRHVTLKRALPSELFTHHSKAQTKRSSHSLTWATRGGASVEPSTIQGPELNGRSLVSGVTYAEEVLPDFIGDPSKRDQFAPLLSENYHFPIDPSITRDFDNGFGNTPDGPYLNSSDEGESEVRGDLPPYFDGLARPFNEPDPKHYFARRMSPSPVAFGSLPSASQANAPWTCLLFRPNISDAPHLGEPGNAMVWERNRTTLEDFRVPQMASVTNDPTYPADHLWLDYFWMPTAEPTHVSSPFATQGKVNMNYQLFPYTYIKRATAMHAVLKGEEVMAIPTDAGPTYKTSQNNPNWRHPIDATQTLAQFEETFASGAIFMTESEICEQFLIPDGETWDGSGESIRAFWNAHRLSGDNTLERPYAGLYSRLTTRSNAFRLHYHIQAITKGKDSPSDRFDSNEDTIAEERRGSKVIERVLQQDDLPDYLNPRGELSALPRMETFYNVIVRDME